MFFENENFSAQIFTVDRFDCGTRTVRVKGRQFSALALRSRGSADFQFADGTTFTSRQGDVIYLPHGLAYDAKYDDVEVIGFHFWNASAGGTAENYTPASPEIPLLFEQACVLYRRGTPAARMEATALFYRIISLLAQQQTPDAGEQSALTRAVSILMEEYTNPELSFPAICERAGISESAFRRNFGMRYGKPPVKFLTELRLADAQKRLITTCDSVEAVALACGFHDVKYFSRVVKRHFGCTPSELRSL